jgi:hypothetical protein
MKSGWCMGNRTTITTWIGLNRRELAPISLTHETCGGKLTPDHVGGRRGASAMMYVDVACTVSHGWMWPRVGRAYGGCDTITISHKHTNTRTHEHTNTRTHEHTNPLTWHEIFHQAANESYGVCVGEAF